jgi:hypothetical protein
MRDVIFWGLTRMRMPVNNGDAGGAVTTVSASVRLRPTRIGSSFGRTIWLPSARSCKCAHACGAESTTRLFRLWGTPGGVGVIHFSGKQPVPSSVAIISGFSSHQNCS